MRLKSHASGRRSSVPRSSMMPAAMVRVPDEPPAVRVAGKLLQEGEGATLHDEQQLPGLLRTVDGVELGRQVAKIQVLRCRREVLPDQRAPEGTTGWLLSGSVRPSASFAPDSCRSPLAFERSCASGDPVDAVSRVNRQGAVRLYGQDDHGLRRHRPV